ncbi:hypothetical protein GLOIN_2v1771446 [Rhizophagus irregularis DAOM 181602=DAOM 197198]|uniref:Uncharacterized protein n=1 Tax=Rhizophagus irregularis (strain DAOM 181602 / DAOM 197198 / MUCL 43194) TaxID=747089 RepID=A0A2P4Q9W7_RHIID|nr:hypothetical protein GLOIN_2v1771446 [Rhizophagus irregularis DAOM 181602=DAOM 197198]POG74434.1 hypothetical protein GLOIN_2v1771446 [Rhizophagus irregularis DAOM 181602=DAOM 197198]CAG8594327.1 22539_t:CDS:2 [Rhizophagus irregularis]|eukprot:XP_025181300.1 hypothetical protein GLOIN_2v1771446 [Rhizophagus irregularis DAOM 181602=DAOM 197198]
MNGSVGKGNETQIVWEMVIKEVDKTKANECCKRKGDTSELDNNLRAQEVRKLTRGIFNDNIYEIANFKEERRLLEEIWKTCYDDVRDKIWLQRCKEVGKADGIVAKDKKRKLMEENNKLDSDTEKINKIKQIIEK